MSLEKAGESQATPHCQASNRDVTAQRIRSLTRVLVVIGTLSLLLSFPLMSFDSAVSRTIRLGHVPGDLRKAIELSEAFAHASGVVAILLALLLAARPPRRAIWLAVIMTSASGITANVLKAAFKRARPYTYDELPPATTDVTGWEFLGSGSFWDASVRSFPSGHTATAWALAISLSLLYPRAKYLFACLACLATYQRLFSGSHFPSDSLAGFGIACLMCALVLAFERARQALGQWQLESR
jgi:membrane-associated phospholipid phosphatase